MHDRGFTRNALSLALVLSLCCYAAPSSAAPATATLAGTVVSIDDQGPLAGARVWVADSMSDQVFVADPTAADGSYSLENLPASTYSLAVEAGGGLFIVESPVRLDVGESRTLHLAVRRGDSPAAATALAAKKHKMSLLDNPLTAALLVVGVAVIVGLIWEALDNDHGDQIVSPSEP